MRTLGRYITCKASDGLAKGPRFSHEICLVKVGITLESVF